MKKLSLILVFTVITGTIVSAQQRTLIGINVTSNFDTYTTLMPEIGLTFERQVTNHSGMEMGLNYRTYQDEIYLMTNSQWYYPLIVEKYLSIPILYKFHSRIINAGIGLTFDYSLGWEQKNAPINFSSSFRTEYDYYVGPIVKLSKEIHLGDNFVLEPEIKANLIIIPVPRNYLGLGIVTKFDLHKD